MSRRAWWVMAALLAVAACGGDAGSGITEEASRELQLRVEAVREASLSGDHASVLTALEGVRVAAAELKASGEINEEKTTEILLATSDIENLVDAVPTTTTTTTVPPPVIEGEDGGANGDKGKGKSNGKGKNDLNGRH